MRKKLIIPAIAISGIAILIGIGLFQLRQLAIHDVEEHVVKARAGGIESMATRLSVTHGLYFVFTMKGNDISYVYWRLIPWRHMELEK